MRIISCETARRCGTPPPADAGSFGFRRDDAGSNNEAPCGTRDEMERRQVNDAAQAARRILIEILDKVLPSPLPEAWPDERPLVEAGLDSLGVLAIVSELETRLDVTLTQNELSEEFFATFGGLQSLLIRQRGNGGPV